MSEPAAEEEELDLEHPVQFRKALRQRHPRPFTFGPIEFKNLNLDKDEVPFDDKNAR